jgi:transposase
MIKKKRSSSFKKKVAIEALKESRTINEIASEFEVHPVQVSNWKKQLIEGSDTVFEGDKKATKLLSEYERRVEEFEKKVGQMTMEIEFLKKKVNF